MASRNNDKINCPTNLTSPRIFAVLLDAIETEGTVSSDDARRVVFPEARAAVSRYNTDNPDTHSEAALKQYGLIEYVDEAETVFQVSHLGKRLLEVCTKGGDGKHKVRGDAEYSYNAVMIDCLMTWRDASGQCAIFPGMLLLKLLCDNRLEEYITEADWAYVCAESSYRNDADYEKLVGELIDFRMSETEIVIANTYVFLVAFSGDWKLFDRVTVDGQNQWSLKEITKQNLKSKILRYDLLADSEYSILNTGEEVIETDAETTDKHMVSYMIKPFVIPDCLPVSEDMCQLQVDAESVDAQLIQSGDKVLFLNEQQNQLKLYHVFMINEIQQCGAVYHMKLEKKQKVNRLKEREIIQQFKAEE